MVEWLDVVVVGAGPGGLGTAGLLSKAGVLTAALDGATLVRSGDRSYDRLRINTSTLTSYLPGMRFPATVGLWPSRDDLVEYYERYVERFAIDLRPRVESSASTVMAPGICGPLTAIAPVELS